MGDVILGLDPRIFFQRGHDGVSRKEDPRFKPEDNRGGVAFRPSLVFWRAFHAIRLPRLRGWGAQTKTPEIALRGYSDVRKQFAEFLRAGVSLWAIGLE